MLSTQFIVKSKFNRFLLAEFWLRSEKPLSLQECRDAVEAMGWDIDGVKWETPKCVETDESRPKVATLIHAFIPLSHKVRQLDNGEKQWKPTGWNHYAMFDECVTEHSAKNIAINWAVFDGFSEDEAIANLKLTVRYADKLEYADFPDAPF